MKRLSLSTSIALVVLGILCGLTVEAQQSARKFVPVTDAMLQKPDPADWLMWRRTLDGWGYSPLNQITRNNVAQLRMVWTSFMISMHREVVLGLLVQAIGQPGLQPLAGPGQARHDRPQG